MGSFNVACSISNLSIGPGDPIAFFPLLPGTQRHHYSRGRQHLVGVQSMLLQPNCYFDPLCLPVFGEYGDYGNVDDIEENANTRALEAFFGGVPIHTIISIITCGRGATDYFGEIYAAFLKDPSLFAYETAYDVKWAEKLGLKLLQDVPSNIRQPGNDYLQYPDSSLVVVLCKKHIEFTTADGKLIKREEEAFELLNLNEDGSVELLAEDQGLRCKENLIGALYDATGKFLHLQPGKEKIIEKLIQLSGMYVHRDIYDALVSSPVESYGKERRSAESCVTQEQLESLGFKEITREEQFLFDPHHQALYRKEGQPFDVKWGPCGVAIVHQRHKEYYVFGGAQSFHVDRVRSLWLDMTGTEPSESFPAVVDDKQPTSAERLAIVKVFGDLTYGATLTWAPSGEDVTHGVYNLKKFAATWAKFTGEALDISPYLVQSKHKADLEDFRKEIIEFNQRKDLVFTCKYPSVEEQRRQYDSNVRLNRLLNAPDWEPEPFEAKPEGQEYQRKESSFIFDPFAGHSEFRRFYQDWAYFRAIYRDAIIAGSADLADAFDDYRMFYLAMYSCNRFFFPAMNGEQCGNDLESRHLAIATLRVLESRLGEQEQYVLEDLSYDAEDS